MLRYFRDTFKTTEAHAPVFSKPRPEWAKPPREWRYLDYLTPQEG